MFVRFRKQQQRIGVSLMQTRRIAGTVASEHVASLGSVDNPPSIRERLKFWAALPERLARLGNRIDADDLPRIYESLHSRIPMVTPDDQRAIQEENAKDDELFWDGLRELNAAKIADHKEMIVAAEAKIAAHTPLVADAAEHANRAKDRLARLSRGETVSGGLGKRLDFEALLDAAGFTKRDRKRALLLASLTPAEFEMLENENFESKSGRPSRLIEAINSLNTRAARKIIRARRQSEYARRSAAPKLGPSTSPNSDRYQVELAARRRSVSLCAAI